MSYTGTVGRIVVWCDCSCFLSHGNYVLIFSLNYEQEVTVSGFMVLTSYCTKKQGHLILRQEELERYQQKFWIYRAPSQKANNQKLISNSKEVKASEMESVVSVRRGIISEAALKMSLGKRNTSSTSWVIIIQGHGQWNGHLPYSQAQALQRSSYRVDTS